MSQRLHPISAVLRIALSALVLLSAVSLAPSRAVAAGSNQAVANAIVRFATGPGGRTPHDDTPTPKDTATATATKTPSKSATKTSTKAAAATKTTSATKSKPVLKGNVYTGANKAYTVTFDDTIWNDVKAIAPDGTGYEGLDISSDGTVGSIEAISTTVSLKECVSQTITGMGKADGFSDVAEAPDLEAPKTASGAVGTMVTFVVATSSGPANLTRYVECRTLVKGESIIRVELAAASSRVSDVLPSWSDLLGGIKVAKTASSGTSKATPTATPKPKKTPKATATATPDGNSTADFPNVSGNTYTSPAFGFTFTWPDGYKPLLASGSDTGDIVSVLDGTSIILLFSKSTSDGTTAESCLAAKEDALTSSDTATNVKVATDSSGKELRGTTTAGVYVLYSYNDKDGTPQYEHLRCDVDSTAAFVVDLSFITPQSAFDSTANDLKATIDGIKFP